MILLSATYITHSLTVGATTPFLEYASALHTKLLRYSPEVCGSRLCEAIAPLILCILPLAHSKYGLRHDGQGTGAGRYDQTG